MKIREIVGALEEFAPLSLQDSYDNAGLQIGLTEDADATGALLCLDVTEQVIDEAVEKGCNLIVSHHPLLFRPCKTITGRDYVERCVMQAIRKGVALYAAHTNLDNVRNGVSFKMAEKLGLTHLEFLQPSNPTEQAGAGLVGRLPAPIEKTAFLQLVKDIFHVPVIRHNAWTGKEVGTVALCGGAGAFLISQAVAKGADCYITGEIGYHRFFGHEQEIMLMEIGHFESEQFTLEILASIIGLAAPHTPVLFADYQTNPVYYF